MREDSSDSDPVVKVRHVVTTMGFFKNNQFDGWCSLADVHSYRAYSVLSGRMGEYSKCFWQWTACPSSRPGKIHETVYPTLPKLNFLHGDAHFCAVGIV